MAKTLNTGMISAKINGITVNTSLMCNIGNYQNKASRNVVYIVMHYTGNKKDTAKNNATYFKNNDVNVSAHFFTDDNSIYQSAELRDIAWHCGTTGKYYHSNCRNANSIAIEMCCTAGNYTISEKTKENSAYLCAYLCEMLNITADEVESYVLRHYDVTHKKCPAQMVDNASEWIDFKNKVKSILKDKEVANFFPERGYFKKGDVSPNVGKIAEFMRRVFPSYTSEKALGNTYGPYLIAAVTELQRRTGLEADGYLGPLTLAKLEEYGFKK